MKTNLNLPFNCEPFLACLTGDHTIFRMDLSNLKGKRKSLKNIGKVSRIVMIDPLFVVTGGNTLYHLDSNLSIIKTYPVISPDFHFFMEEGNH